MLQLDTLGKFCATNGEEGLLGLITFVGNSCTYSNNQRPMLRKYIKYMDNLIDLDEDLKNDTELMRGVKFLRDFQVHKHLIMFRAYFNVSVNC